MLEDAGIAVVVGVLTEQAAEHLTKCLAQYRSIRPLASLLAMAASWSQQMHGFC